MDDLEKTLSDLALAMQDHRDALAGKPVVEPPLRPRPALSADARITLIARLLTGIEAHAGLRVDEAMELKLLSRFAATDVADLGAWVTALEARDRDDPEWLSLIESLTTNETFLFRDPEQLEL